MNTALLLITLYLSGPIAGPLFVFDTPELCETAREHYTDIALSEFGNNPSIVSWSAQCVELDLRQSG